MEENTKKIETECSECKTKFDIWLATKTHNAELEENLLQNFPHYCPACRAKKEMEKKEEK